MKTSDIIESLVKEKYSPPPKSEGWFSLSEATAESGISEEVCKELLNEGIQKGTIVYKEFRIWNSNLKRATGKRYYRHTPRKTT